MNINKLTEKAQAALLEAQDLATTSGHPQVEPEHLLAKLVEQPDGVVPSVLGKLSVDASKILAHVADELQRLPSASGGAQPAPSPRLTQAMTRARDEAEQLKDEYVSTEHLLVAITSEDATPAATILKEYKVTRDRIYEVLASIRGSQRVTDPNPKRNTKHSSDTGAISPSLADRANSTRSSAG